MSPHTFALLLAAGAASLALWILARYTSFGPRSLPWAAVHAVIACALLELLPLIFGAIGGSGVPAVTYVQVFGVALPLLVYAFLSGGWMTRVALGLLRP